MTSCPSCQQPLPEPQARFCIHCGAELPVAAAAREASPPLDATPGDTAPPAAPAELLGAPWDRRGQIGFFTALVDTTLQVLSGPRDFFRRMAPAGGLGGPLLYAVLVGYVGLVATAVYDAIFESLVGTQSPDLGLGPEFDRVMTMLQGGPGLLAQVVMGPFVLAMGVLVTAGLNHLGLMLMGGARRDFEATFRVAAFAKAASVVSLLPLCGPFVGIVWSAVISIIGLQVVHDTTLGKAVAAVLLPVLLACCCCAGTVGVLAAAMAAAVR